jgi:hypothetical protein
MGHARAHQQIYFALERPRLMQCGMDSGIIAQKIYGFNLLNLLK